MEIVRDLPNDLQRRVYLLYRRARARYLWKAVSNFIRRMNVVVWLSMTTYPPDTVHDTPSGAWYKFDGLVSREHWFDGELRKMRGAYNIRPRRGVKRPLQDFLV